MSKLIIHVAHNCRAEWSTEYRFVFPRVLCIAQLCGYTLRDLAVVKFSGEACRIR